MSIKFNYIAIVNYMLEVSLVIHTLAPIIPEFTQNQKQFLIFSQQFSNLIFSVIWLVLFHVLMFHQRIEIINQDNTWTRSVATWYFICRILHVCHPTTLTVTSVCTFLMTLYQYPLPEPCVIRWLGNWLQTIWDIFHPTIGTQMTSTGWTL